MSRYHIDARSDARIAPGVLPALRRIAARALKREAVASSSELSLLVTTDERIRELNREFRDKDAPTDVLSFPQSEGGAFARPVDAPPHLGDVVISLPTAERQAREHDIALDDELAHLVVHGILHLLGYDHERPADAKVMRAREDVILGEAHHH